MNHFNGFLAISLAILCLTAFRGVRVMPDLVTQGPGVNKEIRQFDKAQLQKLKENSDYDYSIKRGDGTTIWQRIKNTIRNFFNQLLAIRGTGAIVRILIYLMVIGAIVFSILKFLNTSPANLVSKGNHKNIPYSVAHENIHKINFKEEIEAALENHDYRLATRLYYLRTLKMLTDEDLIHWQNSKTNKDYYYELRNEHLKSDFLDLGRLYEYAWYGGFLIEQPVMNQVKDLYVSIHSKFQSKKP